MVRLMHCAAQPNTDHIIFSLTDSEETIKAVNALLDAGTDVNALNSRGESYLSLYFPAAAPFCDFFFSLDRAQTAT